LRDLFIGSVQESRGNFPQRRQFGVLDILPFVFGKAEQEDGSI